MRSLTLSVEWIFILSCHYYFNKDHSHFGTGDRACGNCPRVLLFLNARLIQVSPALPVTSNIKNFPKIHARSYLRGLFVRLDSVVRRVYSSEFYLILALRLARFPGTEGTTACAVSSSFRVCSLSFSQT